MSVYDRDAFSERVNYAAQCMHRKQTQGRAFDTCFEMHDGDQVLAALVLRAKTNPTLAADMARTFAPSALSESAAKYTGWTRKQIEAKAKQVRDHCHARTETRTHYLECGYGWEKASLLAERYLSFKSKTQATTQLGF